MVPEGWERLPLARIAQVRTGIAKGKRNLKDPVGLPYLRVANVQDGKLNLTEIKTIEVERDAIPRYSLKDGDVLMTEGGDFDKLGRGDVWRSQISKCLHQNHVFAVRIDSRVMLLYYLSALAGSEYGKDYFKRCAKRSTNLASINSTQLKEFPVLIPPLIEQQKIVDILSTWDEAISATERLIENSKLHKRALMHQLLSETTRQTSELGLVRFGGVFERVRRKNIGKNNNVLTISGKLGLVSQADYFNKSIASSNLSNYTLLARGEFAYNKSYSSGYPVGAIKSLDKYDVGVVSSLYICFSISAPKQNSIDFYTHYFESGQHNLPIASIAQEDARNHGLLNVGISDFFDLDIWRPSFERQLEIAEKLNTAQAVEEMLSITLNSQRSERSALVQQLLTGKRRVNLDHAVV